VLLLMSCCIRLCCREWTDVLARQCQELHSIGHIGGRGQRGEEWDRPFFFL
jgi:hypothetical protein